MSENKAHQTGPDLQQGVPLSGLREGEPLAGHVGDSQVLLVKRGARVFAIGAICPHYSGPLAEGIVVGNTVRCPWHHSRFNLATGDAMCAPALNAVLAWKTEVRDGKVFLTGSERQPARPRLSGRGLPGRVVIVGAGAAGNAAAETLRKEGFEGEVTLIGAEPSVPYDRPNLSKDYLAGNAPEEWVPLRTEEFYQREDITLMKGVEVTSLDAKARKVGLHDGKEVRYDALLLATGASPVRLSMPGSDLEHVSTLRTLADSRAIIEQTKRARRAVIMGASFIGLEVAASLRARQMEVHIIAPEALPLERVMGPEIGRFIQGLHEEHGVVFHLGHTARSITRESVTLDDGTGVAADLVVMGVGVRPNLALAEKSGIATGRGVIVNEYLRTDAPGVYAAGDIARWPDPHTGERIRVEHWVVAERQGQTAARNMLNMAERFTAVPFFWSAHYDATISYVGHAEKWDRVRVDGSLQGQDCQVDFLLGGHRLAVATIGRDRNSLQVEAEMEAAVV